MTNEFELREHLIVKRAKALGIPEPSEAEIAARARAELRREAQQAIATLKPLTLQDLSDAGVEFETVEKRGGFYDLARGLVEKGYALEGCILLLATWNAARFSKVEFDIGALKNALKDLGANCSALAAYSVQSADFETHRRRIEEMFNGFAAIKGVEFTGGAKVMHLLYPELFVAWDAYIRGGKDKRLYSNLACVVSEQWCFLSYEQTGCGYVDFLSDMQSRVRGLEYPKGSKTLAKNLDEWNYVRVTMPVQLLERAKPRKARRDGTHS